MYLGTKKVWMHMNLSLKWGNNFTFLLLFCFTSDHVATSQKFDPKNGDSPHEKELKCESNYYRILRKNLGDLTAQSRAYLRHFNYYNVNIELIFKNTI